MTEREQIVDIWQNKLIYALCKAVRILLISKLKSMARKEK